MDKDTIVPAMRLKTVLEAFRDTNAGKPLQVRRGLTFANCLHFRRLFAVVNSVCVPVMIKLINLC